MFSQWLREEKGVEPNDFPTYKHRYEDGRIVKARLYPNELLADFRQHFQEVWLPARTTNYFEERDPKALEFLPRLLSPPPDPFGLCGFGGVFSIRRRASSASGPKQTPSLRAGIITLMRN